MCVRDLGQDITREIASISVTVDKLQQLAQQVGYAGAARGAQPLVGVLSSLGTWLERATATSALHAVDYETHSNVTKAVHIFF